MQFWLPQESQLISTTPPSFDNVEVLIISNKCSTSIRNNIINYNNSICNLDLTKYEKRDTILSLTIHYIVICYVDSEKKM